jgi:hypothetical protein
MHIKLFKQDRIMCTLSHHTYNQVKNKDEYFVRQDKSESCVLETQKKETNRNEKSGNILPRTLFCNANI